MSAFYGETRLSSRPLGTMRVRLHFMILNLLGCSFKLWQCCISVLNILYHASIKIYYLLLDCNYGILIGIFTCCIPSPHRPSPESICWCKANDKVFYVLIQHRMCVSVLACTFVRLLCLCTQGWPWVFCFKCWTDGETLVSFDNAALLSCCHLDAMTDLLSNRLGILCGYVQ